MNVNLDNSGLGLNADQNAPLGNAPMKKASLNKSDLGLLKTILAGATQSNDKSKAGRGYMGLGYLGGKPAPIKYLTHWTERGIGNDAKIMKSVYGKMNSGGSLAFTASDDLERVLCDLAEKVGAGQLVRGMIHGYKLGAKYKGKSLLSRKIVFAAARVIKEKLSKVAQRELNDVNAEEWHWNDTSIGGVKARGFQLYSGLAGLCRKIDPDKNGFVDACIEKIKNEVEREEGVEGEANDKVNASEEAVDKSINGLFNRFCDDFRLTDNERKGVLENIRHFLPGLIIKIRRTRCNDQRLTRSISEMLAAEIRKMRQGLFYDRYLVNLNGLCDELTKIIVAHIREWGSAPAKK